MAQDITNDLKYLRVLSEKFPTATEAATEIMNLKAILSLPKGTEHFLADIHGEYEAFTHVLKNASGSVREKVNDLYKNTLTLDQINELCTLIYYPQESIQLIRNKFKEEYPNNWEEILNNWYVVNLERVINVCKKSGEKYTRSKVRKALPQKYSYIILELMHEKSNDANKAEYIKSILSAILESGQAEDFIIAIATTIQRLVIDHLHIVGDIYDRGPGAEIVLEKLYNYHKVDIQWGNHDMLWMGAACGNKCCIANVVRISLRYANLDTLEVAYGINLLPLAALAAEVYANDPCNSFKPKMGKGSSESYDKKEEYLVAQMHKAISIIQFKLEHQLITKYPEYNMANRDLLHLCDFENGEIKLQTAEGEKIYKLNDTFFPTIDKDNPYKLTDKEQEVVDKLTNSFLRSEKLQRHIDFLYRKGSMYLVYNNNILYHASIPMDKNEEFKEVKVPTLVDKKASFKEFKGKELYDILDKTARIAYNKPTKVEDIEDIKLYEMAIDFMWYLWCGPDSPQFDKSAMTTFERYFIDDKDTHEEKKGAYYKLRVREDICDKIMKEFGVNPNHDTHIVNGHVPVKAKEGELPIKAGGKLMVIDGGFSKAYQKSTGIAGYTLIYNSKGLHIVKHNPFTSIQSAITNRDDIDSVTVVKERSSHRMLVRDTDNGKILQEQVEDLSELLTAYKQGLIKEIK